ncbi:hypothetical protein BUALT_Bualt03G0087900 [Buddleja alternifolia]|uniref:Uncharacterized protein n=1 Tax=Buddleja alternifolia TaxID=168488 RepID=A0AAV6XTQ4_9LAMI|nr:hypothetical protein BUALT_Bualt03G0087900 [Buddleja alternifolia]
METYDHSEANSDWRDKKKEQARERRRVWDRKRRLSMSLEEKEKHLAKRRRYYQLRRQKEENDKRHLQRVKTSSRMKLEARIGNNDLVSLPVPELSVQSDGSMHDGYVNHLEEQNETGDKFEDAVSCKFPKNSGRLRINQIRHLARVLNTSVPKSDVFTKESLSVRRKRVRLVHVKRLARALNSPIQRRPSEEDSLSTTPGLENEVRPEPELIGSIVQINTPADNVAD